MFSFGLVLDHCSANIVKVIKVIFTQEILQDFIGDSLLDQMCCFKLLLSHNGIIGMYLQW